jgi:hypothetical protein
VRAGELFLAEDPDEEEDQHAEHEREHERRRARNADREHPEPEEEKEHERPEKRLNPVVDRRRAQMQGEPTLQMRPRRQGGLAANMKEPPEGGSFIRRADLAFVHATR